MLSQKSKIISWINSNLPLVVWSCHNSIHKVLFATFRALLFGVLGLKQAIRVLFELTNFIFCGKIYPKLSMFNCEWAILVIISCKNFHAIKKEACEVNIMILHFYLLEPSNWEKQDQHWKPQLHVKDY